MANTLTNATTFNRKKTLFIAQFGILLALEAVICFTPLGSLPLGAMGATTLSHVPVILTAILLGPKAGALMGFFFGLFSFMVWTFMPPPSPLVFVFTPFHSFPDTMSSYWSLLIVFVPRILIGLVAGLVFAGISKRRELDSLGAILGGVLGALTNTVFVLGGVWVFFGDTILRFGPGETALAVIGGIAASNGLIEAIVGGFFAAAVALPVRNILAKMRA